MFHGKGIKENVAFFNIIDYAVYGLNVSSGQ